MNWYLLVLKKYAVFNGRARRKEYWMFYLFHCIIGGVVPGVIGGLTETNMDMFIDTYYLAVIIPCLAVTIRRMHDVGKNGWFWLIPIYSLFLFAREGDQGDNQYGADPKADA